MEEVLDDVEVVLLMTVNPGVARQKLIPATIPKIRRLRDVLDRRGNHSIEIEVDGNVSLDHASNMRAAGANIFVGGTSSIFYQDVDVFVAAQRLQQQVA